MQAQLSCNVVEDKQQCLFKKLLTQKYRDQVTDKILAAVMNQNTSKPKYISLPTLAVKRYF